MSGIQVLSRVQRIIVESPSSVRVINAGPIGPSGLQGIQGIQGVPGSDATVNELNVEAVIGPRNEINGYAGLDVVGKVPISTLPALAITDVFPVSSEVAMLALVAQRGDVAIRSDINATFILAAEPATVLSNWLKLPIPPDVVLSVQGQTGAVVLPEDGSAGTASLRTLGTGSKQALPGTHSDATKVSKTGDTITGALQMFPGATGGGTISSDLAQLIFTSRNGWGRISLTSYSNAAIDFWSNLGTFRGADNGGIALRWGGSILGFYDKAPIAQAAAIIQPAGGRISTKAAIDAILTALGNIGLTAPPVTAALTEQFTDVDIATSNKDGPVNTPSLRTLGTGAQQAASGLSLAAVGIPAPGGPDLFFRPSFATTATFPFSASDFRLHQLVLPPGFIRRLAFDVGGAGDAASRQRPVFYLPDGVGFAPMTLVLDGGQVDTSTVGVKVVTLPLTPWAGGPVWVGVHHDAGTVPSIRYIATSSATQVIGLSNLMATTTAGLAYRATTGLFPTGAPPAIFPAGSTGLNPPIVGVECY